MTNITSMGKEENGRIFVKIITYMRRIKKWRLLHIENLFHYLSLRSTFLFHDGISKTRCPKMDLRCFHDLLDRMATLALRGLSIADSVTMGVF